MTILSGSQDTILSEANAREDGAAAVPLNMNRSAATKAGLRLVVCKLMREVRSKPGMPVWRKDDKERDISLIITRAGRNAVSKDSPTKQAAPSAASRGSETTTAVVEKSPHKSDGAGRGKRTRVADDFTATPSPKTNSKKAAVIAMLSAEAGVTLADLVKATGWLPHTTRAALTGLRKRGFVLVRSRDAANVSTYRITSPLSGGGV